MTYKRSKFSEFQNVINYSPPPASVIMTHCVRKSICDTPVTADDKMKTGKVEIANVFHNILPDISPSLTKK